MTSPRKKIGRPRKRDQKPRPIVRDERESLTARYLLESNVRSPSGRLALAESLATLVVLQRRMIVERLGGTLGVDESKSLPAIAANIRRLCESLGLSSAIPEDEGDLA